MNGILQMVEANTETEPLHYLSFPMSLCTSAPNEKTSGAVGVMAAVDTLRRDKLSANKEEDESQSMHFQVSPWHIAPLHLPLVGQNCWPHMASGFSASLWIRPVNNNDEERPTHRGKGKHFTIVFFLI